LDHLLGALRDRGAAHHRRLRAAAAAAERKLVAVALQQADLVERHPELGREDLRKRRPVALAEIERASDDGDGPVGLEPDAAQLFGLRRSDLQETADADAAQLTVLLALALALGVALVVGELEHALEQGGKIAAVVDVVARGLVGNLLRLDVI